MAITWKKIAYQDNVDYGLSFECIVTTYTDTTHFKASGLTGKGDAFFKDYYACVVWDNGGIGAAPQGEKVLISAYTSADGTFTHTAFTTPLGVGDKLLIMNPRLLDASYTVDGVYVDSVNGVAGTAWPIGSPGMPVSNLTDARVIAAARNTTTIVLVHGIITLDANITGFRFIGNGYSDAIDYAFLDNVVELNNFTAHDCSFKDINISDTAGGNLDTCGSFVNCALVYVTTMTKCAYFLNCADISATTMTDCDYFFDCGEVVTPTMTNCSNFYNCSYVRATTAMTNCSNFYGCNYVRAVTMTGCYNFHNCGRADIPYDCTGLATNPVMHFKFGIITITNLAGAFAFTITGDGLRVTIAASCTAGTINLYGDITLTNNSGGTTVNDYRTNQKDTRFFQETVAATDVNGTTWKDLLDKSTITSPVRICGFTVTKGGSWAGSAKVRIVNGAGTTKIMPFGTELVETTDFTSGEQIILNFPVEVSVSKGYRLQFRSSDAGDGAGDTLALTLDVEELS